VVITIIRIKQIGSSTPDRPACPVLSIAEARAERARVPFLSSLATGRPVENWEAKASQDLKLTRTYEEAVSEKWASELERASRRNCRGDDFAVGLAPRLSHSLSGLNAESRVPIRRVSGKGSSEPAPRLDAIHGWFGEKGGTGEKMEHSIGVQQVGLLPRTILHPFRSES